MGLKQYILRKLDIQCAVRVVEMYSRANCFALKAVVPCEPISHENRTVLGGAVL